MRIAVDAMGGDFAPAQNVEGVLEALETLPQIEHLFLVGIEEAIIKALPPGRSFPSKVEIVPASQVVEMHESPAVAVRRKKDSSIGRAIDLVKQGKADAVFSAGNTGAAVAACTLKLRTLEGVDRPAIATVMPTTGDKPFVLIDAGANTDCEPELLYQFAVMGSIYAREIIGISNPRVGLLSIGDEDAKGNEETKAAFAMLEKSSLNFIGNVEGHDLYSGEVDVVACDGFVGNVVLKTSESAAHSISRWLKIELTRNYLRMLGAFLSQGAFKTLKKKLDPAAYGGAPLLGTNGVCIIGHGSSSPHAVRNGIRVACESVNHKINHHIVSALADSASGEKSE
ncbi:MAG TPA: phosphate acyltransferase PlsX [Kiritimatiellia bacterium]|nr:phosphate acyltransferase PlsX [Kiritimatiellia bacterium]HNR93959.1 phosphate acyltransferase PlsX [Kiritimatiellia bacterium]HNS81519.1 phosphate acyltransferase PlsX [Kiritimatiellia bacterium]HPA78828.1 phosphate acyltransferase PlsX [Kiritimatiellia bacterium]HQQ03978.1 phosphate acyltransferase PlsX [Kiritimatiellia bacterium]